MTAVSWNGRGLAAATTNRELRDLMKKFNPDIVFLSETHAQRDRVERVRRKLRFKYSTCVESVGLSGGLCLFWNDKFKIEIITKCKNYIHTCVINRNGEEWFHVTWVYGNPTFQERKHLWSSISRLRTQSHFPWLLGGDFNEMLDQKEKQSHRLVEQRRISLLKQFYVDNGLMDMELKGNKFTWLGNPREGLITKEKIDRMVANWGWRRLFPQAQVLALPIVNSDHAPLVLRFWHNNRFGSRFKYEIYWNEHPECTDIVAEGWHNGGSYQQNNWNTVIP